MVNLLFKRGPLVVSAIDTARQRNEGLVENARPFLVADIVFYDPKFLVGFHERLSQCDQGLVARHPGQGFPDIRQKRLFALYIGQLCRVFHSPGLDFQNGELVEELPTGDFDVDGHRAGSWRAVGEVCPPLTARGND